MSQPAPAPLRVLIVDDSPEDRGSYRRLLEKSSERSWEFQEAGLGEEGLALARAERLDCVLLDYRLPDLDGLEFLERLLGEGRTTAPAVVVLTGQGSEAVAVQAMKRGAEDYLLKGSISKEGLLRSVEHAVERVALRRKVEQGTAELTLANRELERQIGERRRAEEALQRTYDGLEELVRQRTAELSVANVELQREIAERRRGEEERARLLVREREARREAEEANRIKDDFLATLSHELRTPLNAILGWAYMLRTGKLEGETAERAVEVIERNAHSQAQLISDLLDVSRIITGNLRLELRPLDLAPVIRSVLDTVRPTAEAKGVRLEADLAPATSPVSGDADRLQQVVWNLLANAIKFTAKGGTVAVRLAAGPGGVEVTVTDTGIGIRPDFLPYVFDRFRQAENPLTRSHGGLGLGLSIVRHLVELHGGTVEVESAGPDRGATFRVRLPARAAGADLLEPFDAALRAVETEPVAGLDGAAEAGAVEDRGAPGLAQQDRSMGQLAADLRGDAAGPGKDDRP